MEGMQAWALDRRKAYSCAKTAREAALAPDQRQIFYETRSLRRLLFCILIRGSAREQDGDECVGGVRPFLHRPQPPLLLGVDRTTAIEPCLR
jgi:hypothetical protein